MIEALWEGRSEASEGWGEESGLRLQAASVPEGEEFRAFLAAFYDYYLRCCRAIWKLLPQEGSRAGVEVAERFLAGEANADEVHEVNWSTEGAAFLLDYNSDPDEVRRLVAQTRAIPEAELRSMLYPPGAASEIETRELLKRAAYFADYAMVYPWLRPYGPPPRNYDPFLSADLLRVVFGDPFGA
jgi:hypothetical protein